MPRGLLTILVMISACSLSSTERSSRDVDAAAETSVVLADSDGGPDVGPSCGSLYNVCVQSCGSDVTGSDWAPLSQICAEGVVSCPGGTLNYGSCAVGTCARRRSYCCNATSGDVTLAPCQSDGLRACPADLSATQNPYGCVPTALADSGCSMSLAGQACGEPAHNCADVFVHCTCTPSVADGGTVWSCDFISNIP